MTRIVDGSFGLVEIIENFVKVLSEINGAMKVETGEIDLDDAFCECAVFGQPNFDLGGL